VMFVAISSTWGDSASEKPQVAINGCFLRCIGRPRRLPSGGWFVQHRDAECLNEFRLTLHAFFSCSLCMSPRMSTRRRDVNV
jgi:hypothetical protein